MTNKAARHHRFIGEFKHHDLRAERIRPRRVPCILRTQVTPSASHALQEEDRSELTGQQRRRRG